MEKLKSIRDLSNLREKLKKEQKPEGQTVVVCGGTGCETFGGSELYKVLNEGIKKRGLEKKVVLKRLAVRVFAKKDHLLHYGQRISFIKR